MTETQFHLLLGALVALIMVQVLYTEPLTDKQREREFRERFGWLKALPPWKLRVFLVLSISLIAAGVAGLAGMFFFLKWGAVVYLVATLFAKAGSYFWFRSDVESRVTRALKHGVTAAEGLLFYLVFFGPAKALFK